MRHPCECEIFRCIEQQRLKSTQPTAMLTLNAFLAESNDQEADKFQSLKYTISRVEPSDGERMNYHENLSRSWRELNTFFQAFLLA